VRTVYVYTERDLARFWKKVDKSDPSGCWLWTAAVASKRPHTAGYGAFRLDRMVPAHRFSYVVAHGSISADLVVDHADCVSTLCVRPDHLRGITGKQNNENRRGAQSNNMSSGVRGVTWVKANQKWRAQVKCQGRNYYLGYFLTVAEAEEAAIEGRRLLFTHSDQGILKSIDLAFRQGTRDDA
jgi:hypothetical protein